MWCDFHYLNIKEKYEKKAIGPPKPQWGVANYVYTYNKRWNSDLGKDISRRMQHLILLCKYDLYC